MAGPGRAGVGALLVPFMTSYPPPCSFLFIFHPPSARATA